VLLSLCWPDEPRGLHQAGPTAVSFPMPEVAPVISTILPFIKFSWDSISRSARTILAVASPPMATSLSENTPDDDIFEIFLGVTGVDLYSLLETGEFAIKELERSDLGTVSQTGTPEKKSRLKFWK